MAQLAIKGHATRGKEVLEILEMLADKILDRKLYGNVSHYGYYIHDNGYISLKHCSLLKNAIFFTLEEFLEKYPFKVGDFVSIPEYESEVRICEMHWDGFEIQYKVYRVDEEEWYTSDELLNYNDNPNRTIKDMDEKLTAIPEITTLNMSAIDYNNGLVGYEIPAGYEFDTVIDNKVVLKPIKPQYPKTYEECCKIIHSDPKFYIDTHLYSDALEALYKLLICRDSYWKIAGEQMGLGKPWEPDWTDNYQKKWTINFYQGKINFTTGPNVQFILAFPTVEMRDAFFENFKELIKACIHLL